MRQHPGKTDFVPKIYLNMSYDNAKRDLLTLKTVDLKVYFDMEHCVQKIWKALKEPKIVSVFIKLSRKISKQ